MSEASRWADSDHVFGGEAIVHETPLAGTPSSRSKSGPRRTLQPLFDHREASPPKTWSLFDQSPPSPPSPTTPCATSRRESLEAVLDLARVSEHRSIWEARASDAAASEPPEGGESEPLDDPVSPPTTRPLFDVDVDRWLHTALGGAPEAKSPDAQHEPEPEPEPEANSQPDPASPPTGRFQDEKLMSNLAALSREMSFEDEEPDVRSATSLAVPASRPSPKPLHLRLLNAGECVWLIGALCFGAWLLVPYARPRAALPQSLSACRDELAAQHNASAERDAVAAALSACRLDLGAARDDADHAVAAAEARAEERASYVATAEARAEELASHAVWLTSELEAARRELAQRDAVELARRDATVEPVAEQVRADDRATEAPTPTDEAPAEEAPAAAAEEAVTEDTSAEDAVEEEDAVAEDTSADAPTAGPASDPPARDLLTRAMLLVASVAMMVASVVLTMRAAPDERRRQARLQLERAHAQKKRQQAATQRAAAVASTRSPGATTIAALCDAASPATARGVPGPRASPLQARGVMLTPATQKKRLLAERVLGVLHSRRARATGSPSGMK